MRRGGLDGDRLGADRAFRLDASSLYYYSDLYFSLCISRFIFGDIMILADSWIFLDHSINNFCGRNMSYIYTSPHVGHRHTEEDMKQQHGNSCVV